MGIVVTLAMLMAIMVMLAVMFRVSDKGLRSVTMRRIAGTFVLICGLWNAFWHGVQHLNEFWGQAALGSGLVMIISTLAILGVIRSRPIRWSILAGLMAFFLLYAITLIRLNLGYSIIR